MNASLTDPFGRTLNVGDYVFAAIQSSYNGGEVRQIKEINGYRLKLFHPRGAWRFSKTGATPRPFSFWKHYKCVVKAPDGWTPSDW